MKQITFFLFLFAGVLAYGQNNVSWSYEYDRKAKEVKIYADIEEGWHLYSQILKNDIGPIPTTFEFEKNQDVTVVGKVQQPKAIEAYDANFGANLDYFEGEVTFSQKVKVKKDTVLSGSVYYMVCDDQSCLPPTEVKFEITVKK